MLSTLKPRNKGSKSSKVKVSTNLFKVDFREQTKIYIYSVKTQPEISQQNNKVIRNILINSRRILQRLVGTFVISGRMVFGTKVQHGGKDLELVFKIQHEGVGYHFFLKILKVVALSDIHSPDNQKSAIVYTFLNSLVKNFFYQIDYTEIGRSGKYFDSQNYTKVESARLFVYKGYSSRFSLLEDGLFLKIDPATKVVR